MRKYDTIKTLNCSCFKGTTLDYSERQIDFALTEGSFIKFDIGDEVPYQTPFYNYGEDFAIFAFFEKDYITSSQIVDVRKGKISQIYSLLELPEDYKTNLVITPSGLPFKIKNKKDFNEFVDDFLLREKQFKDCTETVITSWCDSVRSKDEMYEDIFGSFFPKWTYDDQSKEYFKVLGGTNIGLLIDYIISDKSTILNPEKIIELYIKNNKRDIDILLKTYKKWLELNQISSYDNILNLITSKI